MKWMLKQHHHDHIFRGANSLYKLTNQWGERRIEFTPSYQLLMMVHVSMANPLPRVVEHHAALRTGRHDGSSAQHLQANHRRTLHTQWQGQRILQQVSIPLVDVSVKSTLRVFLPSLPSVSAPPGEKRLPEKEKRSGYKRREEKRREEKRREEKRWDEKGQR